VRRRGSHISSENRLANGGNVVISIRRSPFTPQEDSWYSFLLKAESTPRAIVRLEGLRICFLNWYSLGRGGVQLLPLGTAVNHRPIVTAPGGCDDGGIDVMMLGRGNRSTRRKPTPVPLCPPQTLHACSDENPGRRGGKPATNRLSYGTAKH
jgi:hypothetical protein